MIPAHTDGLIWFLLILGPFILLQRRLHRELQAVFLLLSKRQDISLVVFSLLFFPGVLLHETSHYLMALLLRVRTGRFSLVPHPLPDGRLQLGYVETAQSDFMRDSLIGAAPLLVGSLFVTYVGVARLGFDQLWQAWYAGSLAAIFQALAGIYHQPDFWLWFYLAFTVSSTMLPSASDRRAWLVLGIVALVLFLLGLAAGAGPWLLENLAPALNNGSRALALAVLISALLHLFLLPFVWGLRLLISRVTGLSVGF